MDRLETMAPYINSRVAGMRSRLVTQAKFEELIDVEGVDRLVDAMMATPYQEDLAEALTRFSGVDAIEEAVSRNLVKTFQKLRSLSSGAMRDLIDIFLLRWDLIAVKSLLRYRHHNIDTETTLAELQPGPSLTVPLLRSFAGRNTMHELVTALAAWNPELCGPLLRAFPEYEAEESVSVLEEALDKAYFVETVKSLESDDEDTEILRTVLRMEIDRINIRLVFQLKDGLSAEQLEQRLLPKGNLPTRTVQALAAARDAARAMEILNTTIYKQLREMLFMFVQSARFSPMDRMFELVIIRHLGRDARIHFLSIATLMQYAWLKHNEAVNLRLIARGEANNLPRGRVREEMMYA
jgi:V/A-type H+-transporting ATPase subunit C